MKLLVTGGVGFIGLAFICLIIARAMLRKETV